MQTRDQVILIILHLLGFEFETDVAQKLRRFEVSTTSFICFMYEW